ncbi:MULTISPECIES: hydroxymethylglutaryl-CoA reductase, degradative [Acidiplasma]|jgi:hydroxymethylglutaryl-CoA reductase|uniref:3-hydroxy-3-methylglutaryl-CoA reductase n=2 Tax=Acidiplasma TaxID=507753 RepID=A0A0Q0VVY1_9ARCH|nr:MULTISPECIES: hydroxymethylglutaryl-CoA reductase, degradative [Acidiplasma]KJE49183.1 3-hydroxy-3-methylglutaryl-CoA reductase [Acidiplasma sp. MBA-1]KPV46902.1 3-hydroxy-3-methylglutaryl-CoA reductase [Acidiplasma aeolicum]KQB35791.1 3-hydroxy-3-methylglutaryl-CoA reductase [Acidiplasma cupricumulans]KQB35990.1 3-hydroxy-3-methylglutaryl-CoA reductase [Acidiplasma aeolicum]WMT54868.1 MAG: hydroxymethylglutaryl-CoA reductase, degradative [Acidiplasma sp.]
MDSAIHGFHKMSVEERIRIVSEFSSLSKEETEVLSHEDSIKDLQNMIENTISTIGFPVGIATNFRINGRDYLIPMSIEEPSVVAACSNGARMARPLGGFTAFASDPVMRGELQIYNLKDPGLAVINILSHKNEILEMANSRSKTLSSMNAGARDIKIFMQDDYIIMHLIIDVRDAMGANIINTMLEFIAPYIESITGGKINLRIMSNLTTERVAYSHAVFSRDLLGGDEIVDRIIMASHMAKADIYRAVTHNKGIMNGIDAVLLATMNDFRAQEANAHAYASMDGYKPLTDYYKDENGNLVGTIKIPVAVGTIGGATKTSKKASLFLRILNVRDSREFACVLASVGLAQNLAALRALSDEGIQQGHMKLHARNVAIAAGATEKNIDYIVNEMIKNKSISYSSAKELINKYNGGN